MKSGGVRYHSIFRCLITLMMMKKTRYILYCLLIVLFTLVLNGCQHKNASTNTELSNEGQIKITDSLGRQIILKNPVQRAVVSNAYNAELINAVNAMDQVVGVDYYIYQDQAGFKSRFSKDMVIGQSQGDLNYEKIIELKPQVLITTSNSNWQDMEKKLNPFNIKVIIVDSYYTTNFADNIYLMGEIFGKRQEAEECKSFFLSKLDYINKQLDGIPKKNVYFEYRTAGRTTVPGDYFYEMVNLAHGANVFADAPNSNVDIEAVVKKNPQYIVKVSDSNVYSSYVAPTKAEMETIYNNIVRRPGWDSIDAVKNHNILLLSHYVHGGASKLIGTMYIAKFLYSDKLPDLHPEEIFKEWVEKYQHLSYVSGHTYPESSLEE